VNADAGDAATPTTCRWSSSFEPLDATPMRDSCRAARMSWSARARTAATSCLSYETRASPGEPGVTTCGTSKPTVWRDVGRSGSSVVPPRIARRILPTRVGFSIAAQPLAPAVTPAPTRLPTARRYLPKCPDMRSLTGNGKNHETNHLTRSLWDSCVDAARLRRGRTTARSTPPKLGKHGRPLHGPGLGQRDFQRGRGGGRTRPVCRRQLRQRAMPGIWSIGPTVNKSISSWADWVTSPLWPQPRISSRDCAVGWLHAALDRVPKALDLGEPGSNDDRHLG
jgi:hypothetical protein